MQYIAHRVNTTQQLLRTDREYGVELDLRDRGERLILEHEPFSDGEEFAQFLKHYQHGTMILNIKSERIEHRVLDEIVNCKSVRDYFFLDSSFPMIRALVQQGEHRIAVRFSEFEPIENALSLAGDVQWVWVDCFHRLPLDDRTYAALSESFNICLVSPELQGHSTDRIGEFVKQVDGYVIDAVCTKRPDLWQAAMAFGRQKSR